MEEFKENIALNGTDKVDLKTNKYWRHLLLIPFQRWWDYSAL